MHDSPLWDALLTGVLSLLFLILLGKVVSKTLDTIPMWEGFMTLLVDGPEMGLKWS